MKSTTAAAALLMGTAMGFAPVHQQPTKTTTSISLFGTIGAKKPANKSVKSSPRANEAIDIYASKFRSSTNGKRQKFFFESWGMPSSYQANEDTSENIFARKDTELALAFNTLASIYGDDVALQMVNIQPNVLAFNSANFEPSLNAFAEKFGMEESKAMVLRNPGLLSVKPANAAEVDGLTMQLSYVVDVTRPIGALGPVILFGLLSIPVLEGVTGVSRGELLSSLL
jgi:hypothetical protein